jgi:transposase
MKRFIQGQERSQGTLFPACLDEYISEDNPVRVVDVFVEELNLRALGFDGVVPQATGRPAYHPAALLKLYIYGYLHRIPSSRRLEQETGRNLELMWLTGQLPPDHKTIARFRKDNGPAIRAVCRQFVGLCRKLNLFTRAVGAIDGSKFKAVNARDQNFTPAKLAKRIEQVEASIAHYLSALDTADRQESALAQEKAGRIKDKIAALREPMQQFRELEQQVLAAPDQQISLPDPDARAMTNRGIGTGIVGYNVQAAVDVQHHLIVAHEVTNSGSDRGQLSEMAQQAQGAMGTPSLEALADRGYYKGEDILACERAGITPSVPKTLTSSAKADGRFGKQDVVYHPEDDTYRCPAGERLTRRCSTIEHGMLLHLYWTTCCQTCALKDQCTPGKERRVRRWEHEDVLDAMQERLDRAPETMRLRRQTVEHPVGTIKAWMGATHFLTRTLERVRTEMSLHVLAYNLKRVLAILGPGPLMAMMRV